MGVIAKKGSDPILSPMQLDVPDPAYAASAQSHAHFLGSLLVAALFVAVLCLVHVFGSWLDLDLARFGVHPRHVAGLAGILVAPLVHGNLEHLLSNVVPLFVAGAALLYLYPDSSRIVLPAVYLGAGLAVWLFGRDSVHIGASGLVYGIVSYVFAGGLIRRDRRAVAAALLVALLYGALVWGVFPIKVGVSWETHLAASIIGVALAVALRARDVPPRKRYSWEDEPPEVEEVTPP